MQYYNNLNLKDLRRKLRNQQSDAEAFLWSKLRNRRLDGHRFVRQYSVANYILDFYCPKKRLAIEVDGGYHAEPEQMKYDQVRTEFLKQFNIKVIRFWNNEVLLETDAVLEKIVEEFNLRTL